MGSEPTDAGGLTARAAGGCACGNIRFQIRGGLREVVNCHCEPCRRFTGHFMAATTAATSDLIMESDGTLAWWWRTPTVRYGFCTACGSSLFWEAHDKPDITAIAAGSLDGPTGLSTTLTLFGNEASDYYELDPEIETKPYDWP